MQSERPLEIRVTRYAIGRVQLGQLLVPIGFGASILARRFPETVNPYLVFVLYAAILAVFLSGIKRLGKRPLHAATTAIELGELRVQHTDITYWAHHRELARLYGDDVTFALRARPEDADELVTRLKNVFGKPKLLQPRGSLLARRLALGVSLAGMLVASSVVFHQNLLALVFGLPCALLGLAAFAALRQRVLRAP